MKNYKLIKDYPLHKKGDIIDDLGEVAVIINGLDYVVPYIFTTEDGVDIYKAESYWFLNKENKVLQNVYCSTGWYKDGNKRFSTKEAAEKWLKEQEVPEWVICVEESNSQQGKLNEVYSVIKITKDYYYFQESLCIAKSQVRKATPAEVEAHKLGFHIGDKVWFLGTPGNNSYGKYHGKIKSFFIDKDRDAKKGERYLKDNKYLCASLDNSGEERNDYDSLKRLTNKEPQPKLITEEGDKLYGKDKCWVIGQFNETFGERLYDNWDGVNHKYFSKKENAEQYFAELQAEKRGIKIGSWVQNTFSGDWAKVKKIYYLNSIPEVSFGLEGHDSWIRGNLHVKTLEKFAKEEGLKIGIELDKNLLKSRHINELETVTPKIIGFNIDDGIPYFNTLGLRYNLIGFKKFREEWEAKQIPKDGLIAEWTFGGVAQIFEPGIEKTCGTCKFSKEDYQPDPCSICSVKFKNEWQPKELEPELMLGDKITVINKEVVRTKEGSVYTNDWLKWVEPLLEAEKHFKGGEVVGKLAMWDTLAVFSGDIEIGCIKDITWKQLKTVTEAVKKL